MIKLKVKIVSSKDKYKQIEKKLKTAGFIISEDAQFVFKELDYNQDSVIGFKDASYEIIPLSKILYFEAYDHDVFLKTFDTTYEIKEKLYEVESMFQENGFIRINKSQVIQKAGIKKIIPSFNSRINLEMKNGDVLYVTRVYASRFKTFIGFK